jgi:hypothetical protein
VIRPSITCSAVFSSVQTSATEAAAFSKVCIAVGTPALCATKLDLYLGLETEKFLCYSLSFETVSRMNGVVFLRRDYVCVCVCVRARAQSGTLVPIFG